MFLARFTTSRRGKAKDGDRLDIDWAKEAELYAIMYPDRARLIRSLGRMSADGRFDRPEAKLVRTIITGTTPQPRELDGPDDGKRRHA